MRCMHLSVRSCHVIVCFPSSRMRAAVFINLVNMRRAMSSPDNPCVGLTPHNLEQFQKANYLFHSAHNCTLFEFCLVSLVMLCFQKLAQCVQDCAVWYSVVYIHCEQIVLGYSFNFDCTKGLHVKLLNGKKYCGRHVQNFTSSLDKRLSAWVCVYNFAADYFLQPRLDHIAYDHARFYNPLKLACYVDEDGVGQIKRLAAKATPRNLSQQVLLRYAAYICVRWLRKLTED